MTNEEAIEWLISMYNIANQINDCLEYKETLDIAIKALEKQPCECTEHPCLGKLCEYYKQPCEDCISREAVMKCFKKWQPYMATRLWDYEQELKYLPSVIPKTDVLDKIRAEIEPLPTKTRTNWDGCCPDAEYPEIEYVDVTKNKLLSIIDKYKAESEDKE